MSPSEIIIIRILACISGSLSTGGASLLILSFILFAELRTYSSRLIVYLSISDLGEAISWTLSPNAETYGICVWQGYGIQFFGLSACIWQVCIAVYILQANLGRKNLEQQEVYYHAVAWGFPAITIIGGGINDIFGYSGAWCWIKAEYDLVGIGILYIPFIVTITFTSSIYVYVGYILNKQDNRVSLNSEDRVQMYSTKHSMRSRFYLLPFALGWAFGLANRINNLVAAENDILYSLQAVFFPLQGFWNFLMYGLTERIVGPQTISDILKNIHYRKHFMLWLEQKRCAESLHFWLAVQTLKGIPVQTTEWNVEATDIYNKYLVLNAPMELNISGTMMSQIRKQAPDVSLSAFISAQKEIQELLHMNLVPYLTSPFYSEMVLEVQTSAVLRGNVAGSLLITALLYDKIFCTIKNFFWKESNQPIKDDLLVSVGAKV